MPYLTRDTRNGKGVLYGRAGDEVTIVSDRHDHMRIVEYTVTKERFSLTVNEITDDDSRKHRLHDRHVKIPR